MYSGISVQAATRKALRFKKLHSAVLYLLINVKCMIQNNNQEDRKQPKSSDTGRKNAAVV